MSREASELNAIENLYEFKLEQIQEILGLDEIDGFLEELIWKDAEYEFDQQEYCKNLITTLKREYGIKAPNPNA